MKCTNCGFISSKDFYRCPYCGKIHDSEDNVLKKSITIGNIFSIRLTTLIYLIVFNLFGASILVDWYLKFNYGITLWAFIILFGVVLFVLIASSKRNPISTVEKVDLFILLTLILACGLCRMNGLFDVRKYMPGFVIPSFMILATIVSFSLLFIKSKSKIRPLWTEFLLLFHVFIIGLVFTFFLINKYCMEAGMSNPPFHYLTFGSTKGNITVLYRIEEVLIYVAFGLSLLYIVNYNIVLVGHIFRQVKGFYGNPRD